MPKTFVIGDIHGAFQALKQCLKRSGFDYKHDLLISLGDVCDGWPETLECIDELLKIKNLVFILGNHDALTLEWMETEYAEPSWVKQGGKMTMYSYEFGVPSKHRDLLQNAPYYFVLNNKLFVHAGIDPGRKLEDQGPEIFMWDRNFYRTAMDHYRQDSTGRITIYDEVYIGHTPVPFQKPIKAMEVWLMDTGAGWSGVLSMMNIDTKELFTSDPVPTLYPESKGRSKVNFA
jgi:serine/threonine protein phosphatase 1